MGIVGHWATPVSSFKGETMKKLHRLFGYDGAEVLCDLAVHLSRVLKS